MLSNGEDPPGTGGADAEPGPVSDQIEGMLERWVGTLSDPPADHRLPPELVPSYRALAQRLLQHGLEDVAHPEVSERELDRLLADVALGNRKTGQSISATLTRFARLTQVLVSELAAAGHVSEDAHAVLQAAARVDEILDRWMHRLVRVLEESAMRAEGERSRAMRATLEVLSHELDNRLGAARTATDMLINPRIELGTDDLARISHLIRSSLDDALQTVDDVEALIGSWGATSRGAEERRRILLPVLLRKIVDELGPAAREAGVRLELPPDQVDEPVDAPRLRLILFNLVSNGIKYRDPGREERWVRILSDVPQEGRLRIRVSDNGIGIAPEDHVEIFRPRARVEDRMDGSGLGLTIAEEATEQLGGSLEVESAPGKGSTFTLLLPEEEDGA